MKYTALKGTKDVLPGESHLWQSLEYNIRFLTSLYGFREIRTPVIEHTELFLRGVGDTTDIVQKETYSFCRGRPVQRTAADQDVLSKLSCVSV